VSTGDIPQDAIPINFGLFEARGYDLPVEERFDRLWRSQLSPEFPTQVGIYPQYIPLSLPRVTPRRLHALSVLGVTHVMQPVGDPPLRVPGLRLVHDGPDARVYANDRALPRVFLVGAQLPVSGEAAALRGPVQLTIAPTRQLAPELVVAAKPPAVARTDASVPADTRRAPSASRPRITMAADGAMRWRWISQYRAAWRRNRRCCSKVHACQWTLTCGRKPSTTLGQSSVRVAARSWAMSGPTPVASRDTGDAAAGSVGWARGRRPCRDTAWMGARSPRPARDRATSTAVRPEPINRTGASSGTASKASVFHGSAT